MSDNVVDVRKTVIKYLSRTDARRHNILLLGKTGSGKSALLNTIIRAICGEYYPKAPVGRGEAQSRTLELIWYENCGVTEEDINQTEDEDDIRKLIPLLPHVFDAAGLGDVNTPELKEMLELIIGGYIPPGTSIKALQVLQEKHGVGYLRTMYGTSQKDWKITKIVFMQSGQDTVPRELVACLHSIIRRTEYSDSDQYTDDVFVVVTKEDLADADDNFQSIEDVDDDGESRPNLRERFEAVVRELATVFSIEGALQHNLHRWTSYCDTVGYGNDKIDLQALQLLKKLVMPGKPRQVAAPHMSPWQQIRLNYWMFSQQRQHVELSNGALLTLFVIVVFAIIVWKLLNASL